MTGLQTPPTETSLSRPLLEFLSEHEDMARDLAEGREVISDAIVKFIQRGIALSPRVDVLEDRRRMRMILRLWAARLVRRGYDYPDIDIDIPSRRPRTIRTRQEVEGVDESESLFEIPKIVDYQAIRALGARKVPVDRLAEIEREIQDLRSVFVIAHYVERPRGSLEEAVERNFERGVGYHFLISQSAASEALEGYYLLFESLARIVSNRKGKTHDVRNLISISPLSFEWGSYPYIFYQFEHESKGLQIVGLRGNQRQEGLAEFYTLVEQHDGAMLLRAAIAGSATQASTIQPQQVSDDPDVIPLPIRRAING